MKNTALKVSDLEGVITPLITPMHADGEIDYRKLDMLVEDLLSAGIAGILPCGTTGQSATLSTTEHVALVKHVFEKVSGRAHFVVSASSNSTREAVTLSRTIEEAIGPTSFLHLTGYYNTPPQEGLLKHFTAITESLVFEDSNVILYNVPSRTCSNLAAETVVELSKNSRIIGIKEASGDLEQVATIIKNTDPDSFRVMAGEDTQIVKTIELGGFGAISATSNVAPSIIISLVEAAMNAKNGRTSFDPVFALQEQAEPIIRAVFSAKNPIPLAHIFDTEVRLPLCKLDRLSKPLQEVLDGYGNSLGICLDKYVTEK